MVSEPPTVAYCTADEVIQLSGVTPQSIRLEKADTDGLNTILNKWINQCKGLIDSFCHTTFGAKEDEKVPDAVSNICLRMVSNMVALS